MAIGTPLLVIDLKLALISSTRRFALLRSKPPRQRPLCTNDNYIKMLRHTTTKAGLSSAPAVFPC